MLPRVRVRCAGIACAALLPLTVLTSSATPAAAASYRGATARHERLAVTALRFSRRSVDAATGSAKVRLKWTVTDSRRHVRNIRGELVLAAPRRLRSKKYLTELVTVRFALHGRSQARARGTTRRSRYSYVFHVPRFAQASRVHWRVISLKVRDNKRDRLALSAVRLARFREAKLRATEIADTVPPAFESFELYGPRPYVYSGAHTSGSLRYSVCVFPSPAGFTTGVLRLSGPDSQSFTSRFSYSLIAPMCSDPYTHQQGQQYIFTVKFPAGLAPGTWTASRLQLMDTAGNVRTAHDLGTPVTVTGNQVLSASQFTASPNPVNNWAATVPVTVSMNVSGAESGVAAIYLDFAGNLGQQTTCVDEAGTPVSSGSVESVKFQMEPLTKDCQVVGIAIIDGAGHLALYGSLYGAPDPGLTISQIPDTTPPTATSASISPGSTPGLYLLTIGVTTTVAPVDDVDLRFYNSSGKLVADMNGGVTQSGNTVTGYFSPGSPLTAGVYTIGFTITDAAGLSTTYTPDQVPGGPVTFTVS